MLAELDHPHIVSILDVLDDGGPIAIVMNYAPGGSLADLLDERRVLSAGESVAVVAKIADALGSAHAKGVIHGDVKPANILFTSDGEPLLGDFGAARYLSASPIERSFDRNPKLLAGTAGYVDPHLQATGDPDLRHDLYSLAVLAQRLLGIAPPSETDRSPSFGLGGERANRPPPALSIPADLRKALESALSDDLELRPRSAADFAAELRASVGPEEIVLPKVSLRSIVAQRGTGRELDEADPSSGLKPVERGTEVFGPRPPKAESSLEPRAHVGYVAAMAAVLAAIGAGLFVGYSLNERKSPEVEVEVASSKVHGIECRTPISIPRPEGATVADGDLRGDDCEEPVVWDGQVMRFRLKPEDKRPTSFDFRGSDGQRADGQLLLGDWDCDGVDTPALYRPSTGIVEYFTALPGKPGATVVANGDQSGVLDGQAVLKQSANRSKCDTVEVLERS